MSAHRITTEFKEETVKQVTERGYSVAEVAASQGVSTHSLYKCVKAMSPDRNEQQSQELLEAKSEILRLRSKMRRIEDKWDILKNRAVLAMKTERSKALSTSTAASKRSV